MLKKLLNNEKGTLVLLSLLVLSSILLTASLVAVLVVREVKFSRDMENGVVAFYASETAFEEALFEIRKNEAEPQEIDGATGRLGNNAVWTRTAEDSTNRFFFDLLGKENSLTVDVYDEEQSGDAAGVGSFRLSWSSGQNMEVTVNEWDGSTLNAGATKTHVCGTKPCGDIVIPNLDPSKAYSLTVRAIGDDINNFEAVAFSSLFPSVGSEVLIKIPVTVTTTGEFGNSKQASEVTISQKRPWD